MSYEPKCHVLAEQFLSDESGELQRKSTELAQAIQDAIEQWIEWEKLPECEKCGEDKATHELQGEERCPTDQGDEVRWMTAKVCMRCFHKAERMEVD